jgi:hypothetical protein
MQSDLFMLLYLFCNYLLADLNWALIAELLWHPEIWESKFSKAYYSLENCNNIDKNK